MLALHCQKFLSSLLIHHPPHYSIISSVGIDYRDKQKAMNKFKTSQILMLFLLAALLFITPLISSSLRPKYLYLIINLLIFALGAEAGLLSTFSKPLDDKKHAVPVINKAVVSSPAESNSSTQTKVSTACNEKKAKVVEKSPSAKFNANTEKVEKVRKCPSMPSLFFIGGGETEAEDHVSLHEDHIQEELEEEVGGLSGQELFTKAETFIGNFYKQLKMQREESWKRIHGFYQKAF